MILGIGTDLVAIERMADNIAKHGDRFAQRVLVAEEFAEYLQKKNKASFLAKRFAVKEAAAKALGTGFAKGVTWQHIHTDHDEHGKPLLKLTGGALELANSLGVTHQFLSISDEQSHAVAFVVLEKR